MPGITLKDRNIIDITKIEIPIGAKAIPLTEGRYALVDEEDFERVSKYNWCVSKGYAINRNIGLMHRFIMNPPKGMLVDHRYHDRLDNRKHNLRVCSRQQNNCNCKPQKGSSIYKGVSLFKESGKWMSNIRVNSKRIYLGLFDSEIEAAKAYDKAAREHFGEFAYLNFGEVNGLIDYLAQPVYEG